MNIKVELLKNFISDYVNQNIKDFEIDADKITDSVAVKALSEIQNILQKDTSDEEIVEQIVEVFEKYNLDFGSCHNY